MVRICIVEDEPNIIEALRYLFETEGWQVDVISDGAQAVDAIQQTKPTLVVLDYMLPSLSGVAVAQKLRENEHTANLPILMLSAKGQEKDKQLAQLAGINVFMTKPFANSALLEQIKSLLEIAQSEMNSV